MPNLGAAELIILLVVIMLLFGAKRLPDSARSLGRSLRIFKAETRGLRDDSDTDLNAPRTTAQPLPPANQYPPQEHPADQQPAGENRPPHQS